MSFSSNRYESPYRSRNDALLCEDYPTSTFQRNESHYADIDSRDSWSTARGHVDERKDSYHKKFARNESRHNALPSLPLSTPRYERHAIKATVPKNYDTNSDVTRGRKESRQLYSPRDLSEPRNAFKIMENSRSRSLSPVRHEDFKPRRAVSAFRERFASPLDSGNPASRYSSNLYQDDQRRACEYEYDASRHHGRGELHGDGRMNEFDDTDSRYGVENIYSENSYRERGAEPVTYRSEYSYRRGRKNYDQNGLRDESDLNEMATRTSDYLDRSKAGRRFDEEEQFSLRCDHEDRFVSSREGLYNCRRFSGKECEEPKLHAEDAGYGRRYNRR